MPPYVRPRISLVVPVLESYEICSRQLKHWQRVIPTDWEVIVVDDGSDPPLQLASEDAMRLSVVYTRDRRRWTQPLARNLGAQVAAGEYLFMTDIDHIVSSAAITAAAEFDGDRMLFTRQHGVLDPAGTLKHDHQSMSAFAGRKVPKTPDCAVHQNTFLIRRQVFLEVLQGYDETLGSRGHYGGDDVDFNARYAEHVGKGRLQPDALGPDIYVFVAPAECTMFHNLERN